MSSALHHDILGDWYIDSTRVTATAAQLNTTAGTYAIQSISSITTLTATAFGLEVVCTGAAAYAVTLPTVSSNAEKWIDFSIRTTSNALITITPASGTIMGQTTFILGSREGCRVITDGTNWYVTNLTLMPVILAANLSANGVTTGTTYLRVDPNTVVKDIGTFYDNVTNFKYTPLYPGTYHVVYTLAASPASAGTSFTGLIYKNAAAYSSAYNSTTTTQIRTIAISDTILMNGSTDNLQFYVYDDSASGNGIVYGDQGGAQKIYTRIEVTRLSNI